MDAKRKNICRICLTSRGPYEKMDDTTRKALDALLMNNMILNVCRNAVICGECAATVSRCLRFKLQCVRKEQQLLSFTVENAITNICLEDVLECSKRYVDNFDGTCELCICPAKTDMPNIDTLKPSVGKILPLLFPEKKFCSIQSFTTCSLCATELEVYFIFLNKCIKTEENVNVYLHQNGKTIPNDLCDVYDALNARKYKCLNRISEKTHTASLDTEIEEHHNACNVKKYKCSNCTYEAKWRQCLHTHVKMKHNPTFQVQKYKCSDCTFETKWKGNLKDHIATQHNSCEFKRHKCSSCTYETNRTSHINTHMKLQHSGDQVIKYKCSNCSYETKRKNHIKTHMQKQHNADQVVKYKCSSCSYETKWKENLKRHNMSTRHKTRETNN